MPYTIVGSGFGLYGYLPAIVRHLGEQVALPLEYRAKAIARGGLEDCLDRVLWVRDLDAALDAAETVVVCIPPAAQSTLAVRLAGMPHVRTVVLEKPVARDPATASAVLNSLVARDKCVVVNYSFLYTPWYDRVRRGHPEGNALQIEWSFRAHHFVHALDNWKRRPADGGGPLRFYGIQLIAVLSSFGFCAVDDSVVGASASEPEALWRARFRRFDGSVAEVLVDTNSSEHRFVIRCGSPAAADVALDDPFADDSGIPGEDRRVRVVAKMLRTALGGPDAVGYYRATTALWEEVERVSSTP